MVTAAPPAVRDAADEESLDIDTIDDLVVARRRIERGTVVFRVRANQRVGSGHVHHCLQLADELADQRLRFLLCHCDPFVARAARRARLRVPDETDLAADLTALAGPGGNLVVNDVLDTTEQEVLIQRAAGFRVVNIEDLGPGARLADWVVNALYPPTTTAPAHVSSGPGLRDAARRVPQPAGEGHPRAAGADPDHLRRHRPGQARRAARACSPASRTPRSA